MRGSWRPNKTAIYCPPLLWPSAVCLSRSPGLLNRRPRFLLSAGFLYHILSPNSTISKLVSKLVSKLTDFLSLPSFIIVQSPTKYLTTTGNQEVSLPLSLEWHVWLSSNGKKCHAVHRTLSSGVSVIDCTARFYLVPYCQPRQWNMQLPRLWNGMFGRVEGQYTT